MGWTIQCADATCGRQTWASNIADLVVNHRDNRGWLVCQCGHHGYIEKSFTLQEPGETWEPFLRGIIPLGDSGDSYQPFVFLVSYEPNGDVADLWFSYYKDLRETGGRLKLGYGPGGPPNLSKARFLRLLRQLHELGWLTDSDLGDLGRT